MKVYTKTISVLNRATNQIEHFKCYTSAVKLSKENTELF